MQVYLRDVIDENRFITVYVNQSKPFKFKCQQKESRRIMNVETELNNKVNKTHI